MSLVIAALIMLVSGAALDTGSCIDPWGHACAGYAGAVSPDAGVRIDPEG